MSKNTKAVSPFNVIENGFDERRLSSIEMSGLAGGTNPCFIDACGAQACGAQGCVADGNCGANGEVCAGKASGLAYNK